MDFAEWPIEDKVRFANRYAAQAHALAEQERFILSLAAVLATRFDATVAIMQVLCAEFDIAPEALRSKLARGDGDVWERAEELKAMWACDATAE